jgi:hypothetical protein
MRLKVEINTREHFAVLGLQRHYFGVENPWFSGGVNIRIYQIEELLGTKLRGPTSGKKDVTFTICGLRSHRSKSTTKRWSVVLSIICSTTAFPFSVQISRGTLSPSLATRHS